MSKEIAVHRSYWNRGVVGGGKGYSTKVSVKLIWEPRDLWIGVYWQRDSVDDLIVYICLLPMLPVRLHWVRSWGGRFL
jgi:hypothetical protein